ncbi:MAG: hypothetical protein LR008_02775 [Candidatus Pacebacteria bacterium]|nr:hypothetical protein [Candidatus Paceibacterota bacterium]
MRKLTAVVIALMEMPSKRIPSLPLNIVITDLNMDIERIIKNWRGEEEKSKTNQRMQIRTYEANQRHTLRKVHLRRQNVSRGH